MRYPLPLELHAVRFFCTYGTRPPLYIAHGTLYGNFYGTLYGTLYGNFYGTFSMALSLWHSLWHAVGISLYRISLLHISTAYTPFFRFRFVTHPPLFSIQHTHTHRKRISSRVHHVFITCSSSLILLSVGLQAPSQGVLSVTRDGGGLRVGDVLRACSSYTRDALTTAAKEANGAIAHKSATAHKAATAAVGHGSPKSPKVVFENLLHSLLALASPPSKCLFVTDGHAPEEVGVSCPHVIVK